MRDRAAHGVRGHRAVGRPGLRAAGDRRDRRDGPAARAGQRGRRGRLWDLRCLVREQLVAWVWENRPGALPRLRADTDPPVPAPAGRAGRSARGRHQDAPVTPEPSVRRPDGRAAAPRSSRGGADGEARGDGVRSAPDDQSVRFFPPRGLSSRASGHTARTRKGGHHGRCPERWSGPSGHRAVHRRVGAAGERADLPLVRDEIALAKAELAEKGKHAGIGIGLFGGGGVLALYGVGALIATLIIVLDLLLAALAGRADRHRVLFLVAGILALLGKKQVTKAVPPEPEAAIESVRADVDEVKHAVKDREPGMSEKNGTAGGQAGRRRRCARRSRRPGPSWARRCRRWPPRPTSRRAPRNRSSRPRRRSRRRRPRPPGRCASAAHLATGKVRTAATQATDMARGTAAQATDKVRESGALDRRTTGPAAGAQQPGAVRGGAGRRGRRGGLILIVRGRRR